MISVELVENDFIVSDTDTTVIKQIKITDTEAEYVVWLDPQQADALADDIIDAVGESGYYYDIGYDFDK